MDVMTARLRTAISATLSWRWPDPWKSAQTSTKSWIGGAGLWACPGSRNTPRKRALSTRRKEAQQHDSVTNMNPKQVPNDGGKKVNILGIPMVIRIHGRDTGGVVSAVESHDVPGGGPPPHIHHREDETGRHFFLEHAEPSGHGVQRILYFVSDTSRDAAHSGETLGGFEM